MAQLSRTGDPLSVFGANQWLVEEQRERYERDPSSVGPEWRRLFADAGGAPPEERRAADDRPGNGRHAAPSLPGSAESSVTPPAPRPPGPNGSAAGQAGGPVAAATSTPATKPDQGTPKPDRSTAGPAPAAATAAGKAAPATAATAAPGAAAPPAKHPDNRSDKQPATAAAPDGDQAVRLRGPAARIVTNMESSLAVPTATSVRSVPAKLLIDNRIVINNHLRRRRSGKVSFTHLIGYALVESLRQMPAMNWSYAEVDGKPNLVKPRAVNVGIAIDLAKEDGSRQLLVPAVKDAHEMDFSEWWAAYEDVVRRARGGSLTPSDFSGTTISLTNPGTLGTVHSVPRLMPGQSAIIGVGALEYPAEYAGASDDTLSRLGVSKTITLTSTYDHRVIQGAQSGEFLRIVHAKLLGEDGFYERVFRALRVPYEPIRWIRDISTHDDEINKTARVVELIHAFRVRGHLMADTDPLEYRQRRHPDLDVQTHGLTLWDLDREFPTGGFGGKPIMKLRDILGVLRDSYCRTIGIEYMHIQDPEQRAWIQQHVEQPAQKPSRDDQQRILQRLNAAEAFETFLQTKFVGQKRFSLEGGESMIPIVDAILSDAADNDLTEVCIGMAHRGRLNVLANLAGKTYWQIFAEFEGQQDPRTVQGSGDVKYHLGTEGTFKSPMGNETKVYLAANPSHLEAVDPVLEGIARAKQDRLDRGAEFFPVLPVLVHGDAAFAGQGVVAETLNFSQLRGYRTGGTVHIIVNNQVGFTTPPMASRSSYYATDVARMIQAPIFHVNGDDPEACVRVARLAFEFRQQFGKDVVIDMICYRRRGHNEGDDPSMTQPLMYDLIEGKRSVRKLYTEALVARGDISADEAEEVVRDYSSQLERVFREVRAASESPDRGGLEAPEAQAVDDAAEAPTPDPVPLEVIHRIGDAYAGPPDGFTVHPKLRPLLGRRQEMSRAGGIDWAFGELLSFGSLLHEGVPVRLAGQDSRRGTFTQRHAVLIDRVTGDEWTPLSELATAPAKFWIYDSLLSEYAAMGFEYGYSVERPDALVCWEAQFGDFVNGAQTIIDEFISAGAAKWGQRSSVVLLLPHGYEGQGPDHSSARPERFLQLSTQDNMTVAYPSTPASYFHLLRMQAYQKPRRPLVVLTPKSMLRLKAATSPVEDFTSGTWRPVLPDPALRGTAGGDTGSTGVDRVLLCAGKVYYDLAAHRQKTGDRRTAIVRVEQLAPLPVDDILSALAEYGRGGHDGLDGLDVVWVQEEPSNQGAWTHVAMQLGHRLGGRLRKVARPLSAAPATGSSKAHAVEQADLVHRSFARE